MIATDTSTTVTAEKPVNGHQLTTWQLNHLDGTEFTNTKTWSTATYAFAGNRQVTVNSDPITQLQQSQRGMHQQNWDLGGDRAWAAYNGIADPIHQVVDKIGLVDPFGFADALNATWYVGEGAMGREGAYMNAGFSIIGALLPYAGDLFKLGRAGAQAADACGVLKQLPVEKLLLRGAGNAASGAVSGAVIGGGVAYATGGDVWQGATQGALGGALGGFTRGFYMNRFAQACFAAGTPLVMDLDGNSKPIEDIQVGEFVLARDEFDSNGPLELKRVEELFTRVSPIVEIVIRGQVIGTSAEHPFYVPAKSAFIPAGQLQIGDELIGRDGSLYTVEAIRSTDQVTTVYNMRIADHHTYFVGGSIWGWDVWTHNARCEPDQADIAAYVEQATKGRVDWASINPTLSSRQQSAIRAIAREQGVDIPTPNKFGKLGDSVSKRTGTYAARELEDQGYMVSREANARIHTPQSTTGKLYRDPDVFAINHRTKEAVIAQVVRTTDKAKVAPHPREFDAMMDILTSPTYKKLISEGYSVRAVMIRRGATSINNPIREF